jgi:hypothetical protein
MRRLFPGFMAACAVLVLTATTAPAHLNVTEYTFPDCGSVDSSRWVDPINFVLMGPGNTPALSAAHVEHHTGWSNQDGSPQYIWTHNSCQAVREQRASGAGTRFHARFFPNYDTDEYGNSFTVLGVHHEDLTYCGHAVDSNGPGGSGFDQGREALWGPMYNGGHDYLGVFYWGNTQSMQQCDGDWAGSDGSVYYFAVRG